MNVSSTTSSPCGVFVGISRPFRKTPRLCASARSQSRLPMRRPSGRNHQTSGRPEPRDAVPSRKSVRRNTGCAWRSAISRRVKSSSSRCSASMSQSNQESSLSWHQRVVVALLRAPQLVAAEQHRDALREEERREEVARLAQAERLDLRVVGLAFDAAVPAAVVVGAVAVLLAVGVVVLVVVGDEVAQREAVVRRHEVDRRERLAAVRLVEVARPGEALREGGDGGLRRARSPAPCRGRCRSTRSRGRGSCRPGSRPRRRPTARRSASPGRAPDPGG